MNSTASPNILLTGAGFTYDFGGFLASEMWALIFNHQLVQKRPSVRRIMLEDFDYESVYERILEDTTLVSEDKKAIKQAVFAAYSKLDAMLINKPYGDRLTAVARLIDRFDGNDHSSGFFFTLNQDVFIERYLEFDKKLLIIPGIPCPPDLSTKKYALENEDFIALPAKPEITANISNLMSTKNFYYIKLHGSFNWKRSDGTDALVIGKDKKEQISREPLLRSYFDIFKAVLSQENKKLFVIGYGFGDPHINEIIANSISVGSNLKCPKVSSLFCL